MQMRINLRGTGGQMTSAHDMAAVVSSKLRALSSKDVYAVAYPSLSCWRGGGCPSNNCIIIVLSVLKHYLITRNHTFNYYVHYKKMVFGYTVLDLQHLDLLY